MDKWIKNTYTKFMSILTYTVIKQKKYLIHTNHVHKKILYKNCSYAKKILHIVEKI